MLAFEKRGGPELLQKVRPLEKGRDYSLAQKQRSASSSLLHSAAQTE